MTAPASIRALLEHVVDYAGMFPPASLSLDQAVSSYARERTASEAWLLGRFVLPARSLDGLEHALSSASPREWHLSVVLGPDAPVALTRVKAFNEQWTGRASVVSVEFAPTPPADISALMRHVGPTLEAFFEVPLDSDVHTRIDAIAAAGAAAKVRTGGTTAAAIPSAAVLAGFLHGCAERDLAFKATAGLHHAVRSCYPLTYERDSSTAMMHGFLNVAVAAALAKTGASLTDIDDVLVEPSAKALVAMAAGLHGLADTRHFFRSFGSCSFCEPADELRRLELL